MTDDIKPKWRVEYGSDTGADAFWQWWAVTDGEHTFKADSDADAVWLCELLNREAK